MTNRREVIVTPVALIPSSRQRWAAEHTVPLGTVTILAGTAGIAKSTVLAQFIAGWTRGTFDGDLKRTATSVLLINGEDDNGAVLRPRLEAAGADLDRVFIINALVRTDEGDYTTSLKLSADLGDIRHAVIETGARIVVIDPIISLMEGDSHRLDDVRASLDPLAGLAADLNIAIVCVAHFNKGAGTTAGDRVSGSHAFRDIARSLLLLAKDEETDHRILTVEKSNYGPDMPSYAYRIDSVNVPTTDGDVTTVGRAVFLGRSAVSVPDLLARDTSGLGDDMAALVGYVSGRTEGVRVAEIADALGIDDRKARTYAARACESGRIVRLDRGLYGPVSHPAHPVSSVSSVSTANNNDTHITLDTPGGESVKGYCAHGVTLGSRCRACGGFAR